MPKLSPARAVWPVPPGLEVLSQGKVLISQRLPDGNRLITATDGISAGDYVLNKLIKDKGSVLTVMTVFWLRMLDGYGIPHHMLACGADIDKYLPEALRGDPDRQSRTMVVYEKEMADAEFVVRGCLAGTAVPPYLQTGMVCGHKLPPGFQDGDEFPCPYLMPTTKAQEGHDENVSAEEIICKYPLASMRAMQIYQIARSYARKHGIELPDTKFEFSVDGDLSDEVLTPDSSRFWPYAAWLASRKPAEGRKAPGSFDKDPVRAWLRGEIARWCRANGVETMDPKNPAHVDAVHAFVMPDELACQTTQAYRYIFWLLTGKTLEDYLRSEMGVLVDSRPVPSVLLVLGSRSDLDKVKPVLSDGMSGRHVPKITAHIMSCHRHPEETRELAEKEAWNYDAVVCIGSKSLALPGYLDSLMYSYKKKQNRTREVQVIGVALGEPGSRELLAAQLAIAEIPGQPVIMDELAGQVYTGSHGLELALDRIAYGELPPPKPRKQPSVEMNISLA